MSYKWKDLMIISAIMIASLMPSLAVTVNCISDGTSSSASYHLNDDTALKDEGRFGGSMHSQSMQMMGSGINEYSYQELAANADAGNAIKSSGQLVAAASTLASSQGITISQNVDGTGDIAASMRSQSRRMATEVASSVLNGDLITSTYLAAGKDYSISGQKTLVEGDNGLVLSDSTSPENRMSVSGCYDGKNSIKADLVAVAAQNSGVYGTAYASDGQGVDGGILGDIADSDGDGVSVQGCYQTSGQGLGEYSIQATNIKAADGKIKWPWTPTIEPPYKTFAKLPDNAQVHLLLIESTIPSSLPDHNAVGAAISKGANEWDKNTAKNLFKGGDSTNSLGTGNAVELVSGPTSTRIAKDSRWTEAWQGLSSGTIAVTYYWTFFKTITETDCRYNSNLPWYIAPAEGTGAADDTGTYNVFDVQTIAVHELGHTVGLDDLYDSTRNKDKIMYGINNGQVKWSLRQGDLDGLRSLYGA
jgi:hypothetical protein